MPNENNAEHFISKLEGADTKSPVKGRGLIVEFVGPPGAGKTTNCIYFLQLFRNRGLNAYTFHDIKSFLYRLDFIERLKVYLHVITFNGSCLLSYWSLLFRHRVYSLDSFFRYVKLCVFNRALHQFTRQHDVDVLLLDQWSIQGLWSATIFKKGATQRFQEELRRFYFKTDYVLYFELDDDTACDRIHLRDHGKSRFDKMGKDRRLFELKRTTPYLYRLFEKSDCPNKLKFSARRSAQKNAEDFLHQLWYPHSRD